jgi:hypothetical protein
VKLTRYLEVGARAGRNHGGAATLTRRGAQIQGYPTRADEIDAALTKYGLGSDRRSTFLRANYASSLNAWAAPARRRSQSSRLAALTDWPDRKKLRNTLSS